MKSIKKRLVGYFMLVIIITVITLDFFLISAVKKYYYNNLEEIVSNQITYSADFYSKYFSVSSVEDIVMDDTDIFWQQTTAQVQILDLDGNVLMDSIGAPVNGSIQTLDYKKAVLGQKGTWIGNVDYDSSKVMSVAYPLKSGDKIIGVLRFITSLKETDRAIRKISTVFIWVGLIVIFISGLVSIFLSNTIVKPLKDVTSAAEKMACGMFKVRSTKKYDDEIGKLSDTLNYMAQEILKKDELKNEFISSISHELRTPLTSIKGWAVTLNSEDLGGDPTIKCGLDIIEKESDRLAHMVEELLDFSKFVSGKISLTMEDVDVEYLLRHIQKQLTPRAGTEGICLSLSIKNRLPHIIGDENRLKQVFINILDNALKFTPEGGEINISAKYDNDIIVKVTDSGCGIPPEDLPYVKEKFYKGKGIKSKTGLGLSICDEIVKLHGGTLEIDSKIQSGTSVTICLPLHKKEENGI